MNKQKINILLRLLIVIAIIFLSVLIIFYGLKLLYPFVIAIFIVLLINPIINFLQKKARFPRTLAILTTLLLFITLFAGFVTILIAEIISGTTYLANTVPEKVASMIESIQQFSINKIMPFYEKMSSSFNTLDADKQNTIMQSIQEAGSKFSGSVTAFLQTFLTKLPALVSWVPGAATAIIFALLATFFISKDWDNLSRNTVHKLPIHLKDKSKNVLLDLKKALLGFIKAQLILISITFVIIIIGLFILKVNHALTVALIIAFVDLLPYLGSSAVLIPWAIYELITGNIFMGVGLIILYVLVAGTRQFLEPKVLSSNLGMDPLATLIALFVGFKLFGFLGLIIGPVALVIGTTLYRTHVFHDIYHYIIGTNKNTL